MVAEGIATIRRCTDLTHTWKSWFLFRCILLSFKCNFNSVFSAGALHGVFKLEDRSLPLINIYIVSFHLYFPWVHSKTVLKLCQSSQFFIFFLHFDKGIILWNQMISHHFSWMSFSHYLLPTESTLSSLACLESLWEEWNDR